MKHLKFVVPVVFLATLAALVHTGWFDAGAPYPQYARAGAAYCLIMGIGLTYLVWRKD